MEYKNKILPDAKGAKVLVLGGAMYGACVSLMASCGYVAAKTVEDADLVVFVGGADVSPKLYKEEALVGTSYDAERDLFEEAVYRKCVKLGIPMFGICRGAQFLHVMNGGALWQHVDNHAGRPHLIVDTDTGQTVQATSLHHQMICDVMDSELEIVAVTNEQVATVFKSADLFMDLNKSSGNSKMELEVEAGSYLKTKCFFVQGHPEIGSDEYKAWTMNNLSQFLLRASKDKGVSPASEEMKEMVNNIARANSTGEE